MLDNGQILHELEAMGGTVINGDKVQFAAAAITNVKVLSATIRDTTPKLRAFRQNVVRNVVDRNIESLDRYKTQAIFKKTCTAYVDPSIIFQLIPLKIMNLHLHLFSGKLTGEIVNQLGNEGRDGQKGTMSTFRWRSCPTANEDYTWATVSKSAAIKPTWNHQMSDDEKTGKLISQVHQSVDTVDVGLNRSGSGQFTQGGWSWSTLKDLLSVLLKGAITVRNGYDVMTEYQWKGQTQSQSRHIDSRVRLPVIGGIDVDLN